MLTNTVSGWLDLSPHPEGEEERPSFTGGEGGAGAKPILLNFLRQWLGLVGGGGISAPWPVCRGLGKGQKSGARAGKVKTPHHPGTGS
jgi:hypothetical protein